MVGLDLNYQLGVLVGRIIYEKYLPTLSTDMLQSPTVIQVTDETDLTEQSRFSNLFESTLGNSERFGEIHKQWMEFYKPMSKKYLPKTIECMIDKVEPTDMEEFKNGLNSYLWNTDLSHYRAVNEFFLPNDKHTWYSTIILTRVGD
jgi:hypothetical protein